MNIYYLDQANCSVGPYTAVDMLHLERSGIVTPNTQVCSQGSESWVRWGETIWRVDAINSPRPKKKGTNLSLGQSVVLLGLGLLFITVLAWVEYPQIFPSSMQHDMKWGGLVGMISLSLIGLFFYFLPAVIASNRSSVNQGGILLLNFLTGWTLLGWIAALIWAFVDKEEHKV